ncbi:MAG: hypothetical protein R3264_18535 [Anaerolineae bacterium]|nr:hypothetical protein [Anaerolineae bacterium]
MTNIKLFVRNGLLVVLGVIIFGACQSSEPLQANAGANFTVPMGAEPSFDGCASTGPIANYKWTILTAPGTMPDDAGKIIREVDANCSFTLDAAMGVDEVGEWVIELEVSDSRGNTSADTVQVEVTP